MNASVTEVPVQKTALVGFTGYVGSNLMAQHRFDGHFHRANVHELATAEYSTIVCAGSPGSMFLANRYPGADRESIEALKFYLARARAERLVLISTTAVLRGFGRGADETTEEFEVELAYGRHRRDLEEFCRDVFDECLVTRLPALFGRGLSKNFLFDIMNPIPSMLPEARFAELVATVPVRLATAFRSMFRLDAAKAMYVVDRDLVSRSTDASAIEAHLRDLGATSLAFTNPGSSFQFYPLARLWSDVEVALAHGLDTVHLVTEPVTASALHEHVTGTPMPRSTARVHREDVRTAFASLWGVAGEYIMSRAAVIEQLTAFVREQSAPR